MTVFRTAIIVMLLAVCLVAVACDSDDVEAPLDEPATQAQEQDSLSLSDRQQIYKELVTAELEADHDSREEPDASYDVLLARYTADVTTRWGIDRVTADFIMMQGSAEDWPIPR